MEGSKPLQDRHGPLSAQRAIDLDGETLTTPVIHSYTVQRRLDSRRTMMSTEGGAHDQRDDGYFRGYW
jgi:hypothetical protein